MTKQDLIDEKLKKLKQINEERPCSECKWRHFKSGYLTCGASKGSCDFNHSNFKRMPKSSTKLSTNSDIYDDIVD